jgi:hypothetical protein
VQINQEILSPLIELHVEMPRRNVIDICPLNRMLSFLFVSISFSSSFLCLPSSILSHFSSFIFPSPHSFPCLKSYRISFVALSSTALLPRMRKVTRARARTHTHTHIHTHTHTHTQECKLFLSVKNEFRFLPRRVGPAS